MSASAVEVVYVTSNTSNCAVNATCGGVNADLNINSGLVYNENGFAAGYTSALASTPDKPLNAGGARYFSGAFSNSTPEIGITISPTLGITGGVYKVHHVFSSTANNVSTTVLLGVTNNDGCTLSFSETDKFRRSFGQPAPQQWQFLGYLTNNLDTSTPTITFYFKDGVVTATGGNRLLVDTFRFTFNDPCTEIPAVSVTGPLAANLASVVVTGVSNAATKITVYQDSGSGMVEIGSSTTVVGGNNNVTVSGLTKGAAVAATQTLNGQEGCVPASGILVGGGANPSLRVALTIRETPSTGPVGAPGVTTNTTLHFLGATTVSGGAPVDAQIISPSTEWQTVTFSADRQISGNSSNATGTVAGPGSYSPNDSVAVQVYAFRTPPGQSVIVYSRVGAQSTVVTSNDFFAVVWTWDAVPGVDGYRLLRDVNSAGYIASADIAAGTTSFNDDNTVLWQGDVTVTPTFIQLGNSIQWNPTVGNANNIATAWGTLESINFVINGLDNTGPFDVYIDNIQNGSTVFQTFETAPAKSTDYGFRVPGFSGTTSASILPAPNQGLVSNGAADGGTKSFRAQFQWSSSQWSGITESKWLRLTTSGVNNPQVNLDEPISFRLLMLPVGAIPPAPPAAPVLTVNQVAGLSVLSWTGGHRLQSSVDVPGTYTNVPQSLSPNTWTNITLGGFLSPWTNNFTEPNRFFRLVD